MAVLRTLFTKLPTCIGSQFDHSNNNFQFVMMSLLFYNNAHIPLMYHAAQTQCEMKQTNEDHVTFSYSTLLYGFIID